MRGFGYVVNRNNLYRVWSFNVGSYLFCILFRAVQISFSIACATYNSVFFSKKNGQVFSYIQMLTDWVFQYAKFGNVFSPISERSSKLPVVDTCDFH